MHVSLKISERAKISKILMYVYNLKMYQWKTKKTELNTDVAVHSHTSAIRM